MRICAPSPHRRRCSSRCWATCTHRGTRSRTAPEIARQDASFSTLEIHWNTYVLWPAEGDTGDARDLLQAEGKQRLPRLALRARLDLVERGLGGRVLLVGVVVIMVVVIMVMVGVVGVDFLDSGRHL